MKKIFLVLLILMAIPNIVRAEEEKLEFKHPFFYQRLTDVLDNTVYVLTPTSKFFEMDIPIIDNKIGYGTIQCKLLKNEEKLIEMLCNDCTNIMCDKHQRRINTFEILPYNEQTKRYYIRHRVFDENKDSMLRENLLWLNNIMAIHPYQE